jgi:micrococcal nuclease
MPRHRVASPLLLVALILAVVGVFLHVTLTSEQVVVKVKDGDSIVLSDGQEIRYIGIDCPEIGEPFADDAREFNKSLVLNKKIRIELDIEEKDIYKRTLAYVFIEDKFVNEELVRNGLAYASSVAPNTKYAELFFKAQQFAQKSKLGLWKNMVEDESQYIATRNGMRFHRPNCKHMIDKKDIIAFKSKIDAFQSGKSPCRLCKP